MHLDWMLFLFFFFFLFGPNPVFNDNAGRFTRFFVSVHLASSAAQM